MRFNNQDRQWVVTLSPSLRSRVNSAKDLRLARREILRCAQDDTTGFGR